MHGQSPKAAVAGQTQVAGCRIRQARRGDAEAIRGLIGELGYPDAADSQTVHWLISHPEMEVVVAVDSHDKPIGVLTMSHRPQLRLKGRIATIDELVVASQWRRKGIGRELIKRAIERAKVLSVKRLEIQNHRGAADEAIPFFESCGLVRRDVLVFHLPDVERT